MVFIKVAGLADASSDHHPLTITGVRSVMRQFHRVIDIETQGQGLINISDGITAWALSQGVRSGLLTIFCRHTSASLLIQENASPEAGRDIERYFAKIAPEDPDAYAHDAEGLDDMPAHLRAALTLTQLSIPVIDSQLALGTWQGLYLFEHRRHPQRRSLALHLLGE